MASGCDGDDDDTIARHCAPSRKQQRKYTVWADTARLARVALTAVLALTTTSTLAITRWRTYVCTPSTPNTRSDREHRSSSHTPSTLTRIQPGHEFTHHVHLIQNPHDEPSTLQVNCSTWNPRDERLYCVPMWVSSNLGLWIQPPCSEKATWQSNSQATICQTLSPCLWTSRPCADLERGPTVRRQSCNTCCDCPLA
jgi:hypothetical protein